MVGGSEGEEWKGGTLGWSHLVLCQHAQSEPIFGKAVGRKGGRGGRKEEGRKGGRRRRRVGRERSKLFCMHAKQCLNTSLIQY